MYFCKTFFIAEKVQSNIRELEGALIRVVAYSDLMSRPINKTLAHEALKNFIQESEKRITIKFIQEVVADHFNLRIADLSVKKRTKNIVYPRQIAMFLSRELTDYSLPEIGNQFGGRDHTTVLHACDKMRTGSGKDVHLKETLSQLKKKIAG